MKITIYPIIMLLIIITLISCSQRPVQDNVFREYFWYNKGGDAGECLRVGGRLGYGGGDVELPHNFDLKHATKAEIIIEKILCHGGTRGLAISVNGNDWIAVPESDSIPEPQYMYQHHTYPVFEVPLSYLKSGTNNVFKMKVDSTHSWNWPQNLINGVHFRIYYTANKVKHPVGKISSVNNGDILDNEVQLNIESTAKIKQVDYIGYYEGVNWEGDGIYNQWHYHFFHGTIMHHIGTATIPPYEVIWNTEWVPDQKNPLKIRARIIDETGMVYLTDPVENLVFKRDHSVELCKPYEVSQLWVTRAKDKQESFDIKGDLNTATAARMVWASWCPGYMDGIFINDEKVFDNEGPKYVYYSHQVDIEKLDVLKQGKNILKTGWKQKDHGVNIHGMEVNWPGIMVLVKYDK